MRELKIGSSSVRGVVGDDLTPELIVDFACAFGTWVEGGAVLIGLDPRRSSTMLRAATLSGLVSQGCEVIDFGLCPTPFLSFAARELGAGGAISITGSHNDGRWNALKFIGPDGALLNEVKSEELLDIYHASAFLRGIEPRPVTESCPDAIVRRYLEHLLSALDVEAIRSRAFNVAVDFCNGACAPLASLFLEQLGCTLLPLNDRPCSEFAHPPTPSVDNMKQLVRFVRRCDVDLGAALNVDGDRVAFVTGSGDPLSEEFTLPLAAVCRLARRPGSIVTNFSTSRRVDAIAEEYGERVIRTAVGEGRVMERGIEEAAVLAGEGSGGVAALPTSMTFDGLFTLAMVLEAMARERCTPAEMVSRLPELFIRKGSLRCSTDQVYRLLETYREEFASANSDFSDGVRVEWDDAFLHVRASNTEPLLRVIVEASDKERAETIFSDVMSKGRGIAAGSGEG